MANPTPPRSFSALAETGGFYSALGRGVSDSWGLSAGEAVAGRRCPVPGARRRDTDVSPIRRGAALMTRGLESSDLGEQNREECGLFKADETDAVTASQ